MKILARRLITAFGAVVAMFGGYVLFRTIWQSLTDGVFTGLGFALTIGVGGVALGVGFVRAAQRELKD